MKKFLKSSLAVLMSALIIFSASITAFASENDYKYGVDISYHNGEFDFSSSAFEGKSFVMIRPDIIITSTPSFGTMSKRRPRRILISAFIFTVTLIHRRR